MFGQSSETAIRKALALNPSTPVAVVVNLASSSDAAVRSAALRHPSLANNYSRFCDAASGCDFSTPETASEALAALLHDGGQSTIKFITSNYMRKHWPRRDVLDVLAHSPHASIRAAVAKHENTGETALALLAQSPDLETRRAVAANRNTGADVLRVLAKVRDLPREVAGNPHTPVDVLLALASSDSPHVLQALAKNPNTSASALDLIIGKWERLPRPREVLSWELRQALEGVATHANAAPSTLERLASAGHGFAVASNPGAPPSLLKSLATSAIRDLDARDPWGGTDWDQVNAAEGRCKTLAANPVLPESSLRRLIAKGFEESAALNPAAPSDFLSSLADELIRDYERSPDGAPRLMRTAMEDVWWDLSSLQAIAGHANTPPATLTDLFRFTERTMHTQRFQGERFDMELDEVRKALALNPRTPADVLRALADWRSWVVAKNPAIPSDLKDRCPVGESWVERLDTAADPEIDDASLRRVAKAELEDYRPVLSVVAEVARHIKCPPDLLTELAGHEAAEVREGVAQNVGAPAEVIRLLESDADPDVQLALNLHQRFRLG